jgi:hypothetical protein
MAFPLLILRRLGNTEQHYVQIWNIEFHPYRTIPPGSTDNNSFTSFNKL